MRQLLAYGIGLVLVFFFGSHADATEQSGSKGPIIDMHLHAERRDSFIASQPDVRWFPSLPRSTSDERLMAESLAKLRQHNIVRAVTSEELSLVERWRESAPERIIPALLCLCTSPDEIAAARRGILEGRIRVLGELVWQYAGLSPSSPDVDAVWSLAEELDVPMAIHMGPTPSGWSQTVNPRIRIANGSPLLLEDALVRHPKARVYVMHAGWPFADDMVAMLYQYPQLYVDIAWINWSLPRSEFHSFLKRLVDAGFGGRIMFGSDQMQWPEAISRAVEAVESASFLEGNQKDDIFCRNAARFLQLEASVCE
jgi:predicted TIM-barrel fold metal-dependent hydrolase